MTVTVFGHPRATARVKCGYAPGIGTLQGFLIITMDTSTRTTGIGNKKMLIVILRNAFGHITVLGQFSVILENLLGFFQQVTEN